MIVLFLLVAIIIYIITMAIIAYMAYQDGTGTYLSPYNRKPHFKTLGDLLRHIEFPFWIPVLNTLYLLAYFALCILLVILHYICKITGITKLYHKIMNIKLK